ncbi:hypothetical protein [Mucisphaera calidilacus]|uniref:Uncharacterized protein n=1 Tax=Mucisphaera calidilacus TaxID=2527982 RepID=A0A518BZX6_9BACT|nr:hypothetical protein [Mucisphaera calidilacus]QDU72523.1 hypothetical protein Pan265_23920 [Mucisphaera calidilacus]
MMTTTTPARFHLVGPLIALLVIATTAPLLAQPDEGPQRRDDRPMHNQREGRGEGRGMPRFLAPPPRDDRGGPWERMSAEEAREFIDAAMEIVGELDPDAVQRMRYMAERNPHMLLEIMRRRFPRLEALMELRETNPELFQLRIQDFKLNARTMMQAKRIRELEENLADPAEIERQETDLREAIAEHFEVRQKIREIELKDLETEIERLTRQVTRLREEIDSRTTDPEGIIDGRLNDLLDRDQTNF